MANLTDIETVVSVGEKMRDRKSEEATYEILKVATETVNKTVDPTSAVGRIMLATLLQSVAYKLNIGHTAYQPIMNAVWTLNPPRK